MAKRLMGWTASVAMAVAPLAPLAPAAAQDGRWGNSGGWQGQSFAGEIACRSLNNRNQQCRVPTQNRVVLLQQLSDTQCVQNQNWRFDRSGITVRNGCQARFGFGYGDESGGQWGGGGNQGGGWQGGNQGGGWQGGNQGGGWNNGNQGFAGNLDCRSLNNRSQRCQANTGNRVELVNQFSQTQCVRGRNWGFDNRSIWVTSGCQARFAYGFGNQAPDYDGGQSSGGGSNTGAIIGGAALAAGLIALLANAGKGRSAGNSTASGPAALDADIGRFPSDARAEGQACLAEAARQVGATGGTRLRLDQVDRVQRSGDGWMVLARATGTWPDHSQNMTMDCRARGGTVTAFDIR